MTGRGAAKALAALAGALLAVGLGAFLLDGLDDAGAAPRDELAACARLPVDRRGACFDDVFAREAASGNVPQTLAALERLVDGGALDDCHLQSHALAHAAVRVVGIDRALLLTAEHCRRGYVHGVTELTDPAAGTLSAPVGALVARRCAQFRKRELVASCAHGFGHALVRGRRASLADAVAGCKRAERVGVLVLPCEAGVMMQHGMNHAHLPAADYVRVTGSGCAALVEERLRTRCFRNVGVVAALVLTHHDEARTAALCRLLPGGRARADCAAGGRNEIDQARS